MPIIHVLDTPVYAAVQQCAHCGTVISIPLNSLLMGSKSGSIVNPNAIMFPACASCGSVEMVQRTFDAAPEDLADHRKKVNALAQHLIDAGKINPDVAAEVAAEKRTPVQIGALLGPVSALGGMPIAVLPDGMKLPDVVPDEVPSAAEEIASSVAARSIARNTK